jgi:hypothetical protein
VQRIRRIVEIALQVLAVLFIALSVYLILPELKDGATNACYYHSAPSGEEGISPDDQPSGYVSLFPLGVACTWSREDGSSVTEYTRQWVPTVLLYGGIAVGATGLVLSLLPAKKQRSE